MFSCFLSLFVSVQVSDAYVNVLSIHSHSMSCKICSKLSATIFRVLISCTLMMDAAGAPRNASNCLLIYTASYHIPEDLKCQQHCSKVLQY